MPGRRFMWIGWLDNHLEVEETTGTAQEKTGSKKVIAFKKAIIAAGSQAVRLPFMPDDPRVVDSTGALALQGVPQKMLIVGGGIIGLEMGTVYRGPLVFSAITGGTQTQHWRGGGVGRSLILLAFLFTSQTGIVASH